MIDGPFDVGDPTRPPPPAPAQQAPAPDPAERIRRNVAKMRAANAPDADIEHYLTQVEGLQPKTANPGPVGDFNLGDSTIGPKVPSFSRSPTLPGAPPVRTPRPGVAPAESTRARPDYVTSRAQESAEPMLFGPGLARAFEQGATLGWGDELNAGLRSAGGPATYSGAHGNELSAMADYREAHPVAGRLAELFGGLVPAYLSSKIPGMGVVGGGAALGAIEGAGNADEGLSNRLEGAAVGAGAGSLAGLGLRYLVAPAANMAGDFLRPRMAQAGRWLSLLRGEGGAAPATAASSASAAGATPSVLTDVEREAIRADERRRFAAALGGDVPAAASAGPGASSAGAAAPMASTAARPIPGGTGASAAPAAAAPAAGPLSSLVGKARRTVSRGADLLSPPSPDERAEQLILDRLKSDKVGLGDLETAAAAAGGKPVALPDLAGQNTMGLARGARAVPSQAKEEIPAAIYSRAEQRAGRVRGDVETAAGAGPGDVLAKADELIATRKANAAPLYDAAYKAPPIDDEDVLATMRLPQFQSAYKRAVRIANTEGVELPPLTKTETIGGVETKTMVPQSIQSIDYVKRGLDDLIDSKMRGGSMGRTEARALRGRLHDMLARVDELAPEYKAARAQFAGDSELMNALENGRKFADAGTEEREIPRLLKGMSDGEKELYTQGAVDAINQKIRGASDGTDVVRTIFGSEIKRGALKSLVGDDAFKGLEQAMGTEGRMTRTDRFVLGGSNTVDKAGEQLDLERGGIPKALLQVLTGKFGHAAQSLSQSVLMNRLSGVTEQTANALSPMLTAGMNGDAAALQRLLIRLRAAEARTGAQRAARATASRPFTAAAGGLAGNAAAGGREP